MTVDSEVELRRREAATWFARLRQKRIEREDIVAFTAWRKTPANAEAFARIEALWNASEALGRDREIADAALQAAHRGRGRKARRAIDWKPAIAGVATLIVAVGAAFWAGERPEVYQTGIGERRVIQLADGSEVTLDTTSRLVVRLSGRERSLDLSDGRALFEVEPDPQRPFVVKAGGAQIIAVGTVFDVRRVGENAQVVLVEGRVRVDAPLHRRPRSWTLQPGQQIDTATVRPRVASIDPKRAISWTTGRLVFDHTPVELAIAEVNRYSPTRLDLRSPGLAGSLVSGAFDAGDVDAFVAALTDLYPIVADPEADGVIVLRDAPAK